MRDYRNHLAFQQEISSRKALEYELREDPAEESLDESDINHDNLTN